MNGIKAIRGEFRGISRVLPSPVSVTVQCVRHTCGTGLRTMNDDQGQVPVRSTRRRVLETVTVERPRCPKCGGVRLRKYRSVRDQGDGSALWWVKCEKGACGHRFRVLLE